MYAGTLLAVLIVIYGLYIITIGTFIKGVKKIPYFKPLSDKQEPISCIIPFRNEEKNLPKLASCLKAQNINKEFYEVIFVDDHSTDRSFELLKSLTKNITNYKVVCNKGTGKKDAIKQGVAIARHNYIITTDADCTFHSNWLHIISQYLHSYSPDILIGPVEINRSSSFLSKFQSIDFLSLVTCGAGAAAINKAIMCNAANLAFSKKLYNAVYNKMQNQYASGDDIFLLHSAKSINASIQFIKNSSAIVKTDPAHTLKQFLNQRIRWASKSKGYTDGFTLFVAWLVFLSNFIAFILPFTILLSPVVAACILVLFIVKSIVDYYLLKQGSKLFDRNLPILTFLYAQLFYPFYIVVTVFYAAFGTVRWKERDIIKLQ